MLRSLPALALALAAAGAAPAGAAEITEIPPFLRGDLAIGYGFQHLGGSLVEGEEEVGQRTWDEHGLTYQGVFSAGPGVALFFELPQVLSSRLAFPAAQEMVYDPSSESGTMAGTEAIEGLEAVKGSGAEGLWIGIKGTPFSQAFEKRGNRATWLLEGALQTRSRGNFYELDEEGARGAGVGGGGLRLGTAFSTRHGISEPYLAFRYTRTRDLTVSLYSTDGTLLAADAILEPADQVEVEAGTELVVHDNAESHSRFAFDLRGSFGYATWQTVPSGLFLPSVLEINRGVPATESEYTWIGGSLALRHQVFAYMAWNLTFGLDYQAPHRVEHLYAVRTGSDTLELYGGAGIKVMIR